MAGQTGETEAQRINQPYAAHPGTAHVVLGLHCHSSSFGDKTLLWSISESRAHVPSGETRGPDFCDFRAARPSARPGKSVSWAPAGRPGPAKLLGVKCRLQCRKAAGRGGEKWGRGGGLRTGRWHSCRARRQMWDGFHPCSMSG